MTISYTTLAQVIRGNFDGDGITNRNLDEELPHLAGNVGENLMAILKANCIHGRRKDLDYSPRDLDCLIVCTCHTLTCVTPEDGSGGWIRTSDQLINSQLRYHCATPERRWVKNEV